VSEKAGEVCRALKAQPKCDLDNLQTKLLQQVARLIVLNLQQNTSVAGTVSHLPQCLSQELGWN
ncbi:MAG: hypothetical protein OET08_00840, partial [Desulfuromonadales bacterium]|nr:hypothetical protein [Desulfuromonadales bacterium]